MKVALGDTMQGSISVLTFALLFLKETVVNGEPQATDYLPAEPAGLILPTKAGTFNINDLTVPKDVTFRATYMKCGKTTVTKDDMNIGYSNSISIDVDCTSHPGRIVVPDGNTASLNPKDRKLAKCQGLQTCTMHPDLKRTVHGPTHKDMQQSSIKGDMDGVDICKNSPRYLFSNELGCDESTQDGVMVPRWKTDPKTGFFEVLRSFTYKGSGITPAIDYYRTNSFLALDKAKLDKSSNQWKTCTASCDRGKIVKVNMKEASWKMTLYLRGSTKGFKVCIDATGHDEDGVTPKCKKRFEMYIMPRNGLVVWPKSGRASILDMKTPKIQNNENYAIELGYGFGERIDGVLPGEFYVANMFREVVVSDSLGWTAGEARKLSFFFPSDDSLLPDSGINSDFIESAKTYISSTDANNVQDLPVKNSKKGEATTGKEDLKNDPVKKYEPVIGTTTQASPRILSNAAAGALLMSTDNASEAIYMPGKWWAWGLFIGFIIGSILGVAIIGGIFYLLRRTVYGFWYRGMYKRYGCDVSGTTGGITGVGFSDTTTGAITIGGTTAGGTTAGGTTTGMTTGTKTSGTTGSTTATGGASTIAM